MKDEDILKLSRETREKFLEALSECNENSPDYKALDNAIWGLEDLEQHIAQKNRD